MRFIEEIVADTFLPTVRSMIAERLRARGMTQLEVADSIGVSQSAVSKYVHGNVEQHPDIMADQRVIERVDTVAQGLAEDELDAVGALIELEVLIRELEAPGAVLARLHESAVPGLAAIDEPFSIHDADSQVRRRESVRASVRRAVNRIERTPWFVSLLPQVGSNVVEILPNESSTESVAGVPGRIIDVEGHVEIPADPAFGVSGHVAGVLLAVREHGSPANAAINIRHDEALLESLRNDGATVIEVPGDTDLSESLAAVDGLDADDLVLAQTGGFGIEPITYLFGPDAESVVSRACSLLEV